MWCEKDIHQNLDDVTYSFLFIFIFYIIQKLVARYTVDFCRNWSAHCKILVSRNWMLLETLLDNSVLHANIDNQSNKLSTQMKREYYNRGCNAENAQLQIIVMKVYNHAV